MAYTINSASDSRGDEDQFVADFERNRPAILAYKQQHGGDLEGAYQKVTGRPWPEGRSVKISNGRAEMTKDRTVKSVLGKYVLPAAAAVAAPYALGALAGGGGAAAGAAGGGAGASGLGAAGAAAGTSSLWKNLITAGIPAGAGVANAVIQSKANTKASELEAEAADKALAEARAAKDQDRADSAPYRQMGISSLNRLYEGLGLQRAELPPDIQAQPPQAPGSAQMPQGNAPMSLASMGQGQQNQPQEPMVNLKAPNGQMKQVPQSQAQHYVTLGAQVVR